PLRLDLAEWRAETTDGTRRLMLERAWQREWARRGEAESARLAFRWSLFPTEQRFEPGDWNMGMTTYPFPPGTRFDLHAVWHRGETLRRATLEDVVCAPDVSVEEYRRPE
ncbi:MAG: hypothetical protein GWO02_05065, partial [Gammaproteobacteria bacterium]|nr:hypothetical protein [Gammaproteobacteria bacterium]